jgi:hypothetical protein
MAKEKKERVIVKGSLKDRVLQLTSLEKSAVLSESTLFDDSEYIPTDFPLINLALSGKVDGGLYPGVHIIAGPSRHFKTSFALVEAQAFLKHKKDGLILFYDNEFGTTTSYFDSYGIDSTRVVHLPFKHVEELKFDLVKQLENLTEEDEGNVFILVDSLGSAASKKETNDAIDGNSSADMTRAKEIKSLMRIILPYIRIKRLYSTIIAHTYKTMEFISKEVLGSGQGPMLAANNVWFISRRQGEKDEDGNLEGYDFTIKAEKSRFVKEGKKFPVEVSWENGIEKYSGLAELASEFGVIDKVKEGKKPAYEYNKLKVLADDIGSHDEFWKVVFKETEFSTMLKDFYGIPSKSKED